ncbi:MAG TPA: lipopolysaccharide heptosyltransferase II [Xanthobacteraceae bacterium]|nr:lipopolysaccharide heptosyltransferase II [Xanthobacteraceae bacterium]
MQTTPDTYSIGPDGGAEAGRPILLVPYMWIGDFVRCHTVVRLLNARFPGRPVDILTSTNTAPLVDYMPGARKGIVWDLPRRRLALGLQRGLAARLRAEGYGQSLVMPRTWKAALAPFLAGIPVRTGFAGEARFGLLNDIRWGEKALPRMVDRCAALALPRGAPLPELPLPQLRVPAGEITAWRGRNGVSAGVPAGGRRVAALAPGAVGPSKRWSYYAELAVRLAGEGFEVWVVGGPGERDIAAQMAARHPAIRDLTGTDLRNAIVALAAADVVISNDSGLLHVAAAIGTPSIGIFGPTSPWHWAPLNPISAVIQAATDLPCRPCHEPVCRLLHHGCMRDIPVEAVAAATHAALNAEAAAAPR